MPSRPERGSLRVLVLTLLALAAMLAALAMQPAWLPKLGAKGESSPAAPCWVMLGPLRAVTGDGSALELRLALDACDPGTREAINHRRTDLEAIVGVVVAELRREDLEGTQGIEHLRGALVRRLSAHVQGAGGQAVRDVAVDQFVMRRI